MNAVLLMAHGTPESLDDIPEYLRLVRGGRPPSAELVAEMRHNYAAAGGRSPLTEITLAQGAALQRLLGTSVPVVVGMRNWRPFIADAIDELQRRGARHIIGIPLAPQFSSLSVQKYIDAATAGLPDNVSFQCVRSFHDHPLLVEAFAQRLQEALPLREAELLVFTAHSLPVRVVEAGDPYPNEVAATAAAVANRAGTLPFALAYQSAGRTPEPWIGPDLLELIRQYAARGARRVLVAPIGFVCDHTEILYDIDVQAAAVGRMAGVELRRTESLNTSDTFIRALAALVEASTIDDRRSTIDNPAAAVHRQSRTSDNTSRTDDHQP